mgnify:CR=1 FL=1
MGIADLFSRNDLNANKIKIPAGGATIETTGLEWKRNPFTAAPARSTAPARPLRVLPAEPVPAAGGKYGNWLFTPGAFRLSTWPMTRPISFSRAVVVTKCKRFAHVSPAPAWTSNSYTEWQSQNHLLKPSSRRPRPRCSGRSAPQCCAG